MATDVIGTDKGPIVRAKINAINAELADKAPISYNPDFYKYSIVRTVASGNLTVALKNYEGNDPTPTKPVKVQIGGVVRSITSALSLTTTSGANIHNAGSAELATKEIDYFVYLAWSTSTNSVIIAQSRTPYVVTQADGNVATIGDEKFLNRSAGANSTDSFVNIGRFNATLSGGAGYTWSIPATSVIINSPIYDTRENEIVPLLFGDSGSAGTFSANYNGHYCLKGNTVYFQYGIKCTNVGSWSGSVKVRLPFTSKSFPSQVIPGYVAPDSGNPVTTGRGAPHIDQGSNNILFLVNQGTVLSWGTFVVNDVIILQGFYNI